MSPAKLYQNLVILICAYVETAWVSILFCCFYFGSEILNSTCTDAQEQTYTKIGIDNVITLSVERIDFDDEFKVSVILLGYCNMAHDVSVWSRSWQVLSSASSRWSGVEFAEMSLIRMLRVVREKETLILELSSIAGNVNRQLQMYVISLFTPPRAILANILCIETPNTFYSKAVLVFRLYPPRGNGIDQLISSIRVTPWGEIHAVAQIAPVNRLVGGGSAIHALPGSAAWHSFVNEDHMLRVVTTSVFNCSFMHVT